MASTKYTSKLLEQFKANKIENDNDDQEGEYEQQSEISNEYWDDLDDPKVGLQLFLLLIILIQHAGNNLMSNIGKSLKKKITNIQQKVQTTGIGSNADLNVSQIGGTAGSLFSSPAKFGVNLESQIQAQLQQQINTLQEQVKKVKVERDNLDIILRKERIEKARMEQKIKKMENAHDIEKRNLKAKVKHKAKEKYNFRLNELQKKFKQEIQTLIEQFNDSRTQLIKRDFLIKKLLGIIALQEQQNIQFRSELCITEHPRWKIIPSFEIISIIDLSKLIHLIMEKYHGSTMISYCRPEQDEEKLEKVREQKTMAQSFTIPTQSYLGLLIQGAEGALLDKPSANLQSTFGQKSLNDDARVLNVKIDRLKKKIDQQDERFEKQNEEFQQLEEMFNDHLNKYETAVNTQTILEQKIRDLENNQSEKINSLIEGYKAREELILKEKDYLKDELFRYKNDTKKELDLKEVLVERQKHYIDLLRKELVFAKNIIKNPNLFQKAFEDMNFDQVEFYQNDLRPIDRMYKSKLQPHSSNRHQDMLDRNNSLNRSHQQNPSTNRIIQSAFNMPPINQANQRKVMTKRNMLGIYTAQGSPQNRQNERVIRNLKDFTTGIKILQESTLNEDIVGFQSQTSKGASPFTHHDISVFLSKQQLGEKSNQMND
ncbi:UNKNOWN [Stylonychia lemnae]|uniref:Uncharacterized protein n=1 Tax=Stylonychia lemnae TaxID=5949 RepID=A0A077ZMF6_STYLE|nr:UNKNOWN [Stylonychia lemnae]|eukprot:CDW71143.1 UNKNOWN [Stylonychia lemnae]